MSVVLSPENKALSLTQRKNVRDNEDGKVQQLKEIEAITGVSGWTFDFEGDIIAFINAIDPGTYFFFFLTYLFFCI